MPCLILALGLLIPIGPDDPPKAVAPIVLDDEARAKLHAIAFQAAREGDEATLAAYFAAGLPADVKNARGDTLLILAAYHGHEGAVRLILDRPGLPVDERNKSGLTALTAAAFKGFVPIADRLVARGADVNLANASGQTALMFASLSGRKDAVAFLLGKGADPLAEDAQHRTARALAKGQGADEVVALLVAAEQARTRPKPTPTPAARP